MRVEPGIVDANILIYAVNTDAPQHTAARHLLEEALNADVTLYVTSQILCEFYSVVTNPKRIARPFTAAEATQMIVDLLELPGLRVLPTPVSAAQTLTELLKRRPVAGAGIFDLQIVATMQANDIQRIYTFNESDFEVFNELVVIAPF